MKRSAFLSVSMVYLRPLHNCDSAVTLTHAVSFGDGLLQTKERGNRKAANATSIQTLTLQRRKKTNLPLFELLGTLQLQPEHNMSHPCSL